MIEKRSPPRRRPALEILALSALAIAQPIFDVLSRDSDYFVAHGTVGAQLVGFALLVYLVPVLLLALASGLLRRTSPRFGEHFHSVIVAILAAAIVLPPLDRAGTAAPLALLLSLGLGITFAIGLRHWAALQSSQRQPALYVAIFPQVRPVSRPFEFWVW